jgi:hypothetical protein
MTDKDNYTACVFRMTDSVDIIDACFVDNIKIVALLCQALWRQV